MIAKGIVMSSASPASFADRPIASASSGRTGLLVTNEFPKSSVNTPDDRVDVPLDERPVGAQPLVERIDALLRRERAEDRPADVVGQDVGDDEDDRGEQPQREEREQQPARMKRAIACLRAVPSNGWVDEGGGRSRRPQALRCQATWEVVAKDIWPRALENTPVNLLELPAR